MTANLLSMGAIDFGIIIDGAVVMVEGLFVVLALKAHDVGMEKYNKMAKLGHYPENGFDTGQGNILFQNHYHHLPDSDFCL